MTKKNEYKYAKPFGISDMAEQDQTQKEIAELKKKVTTMFQAMQRMERLLKQTEQKASRAVGQAQKNAQEVTQLKALLNRRE